MKGKDMIAVIGIVIILLGVLFMYHIEVQKKIDRLDTELTWYKKAIQTKNGWSRGFESYNIVSFDGGETWYNYEGHSDPEATRNDGFHFLTPADTNLVTHVKAWDNLLKYVDKNGPMDLTGNEDTIEYQKKLMEDAGFEIKEKK